MKRAALEELATLQSQWDKLYEKVSSTQFELQEIEHDLEILNIEMQDSEGAIDNSEAIADKEARKTALRTKQYEKDEAAF